MASAGEQIHETIRAESSAASSNRAQGLEIPRIFSTEGVSPFDEVVWDKRTAEIKDDRGAVIFQQTDVDVPQSWSQLATNVVVSKYFYGEIGTDEREGSVRDLIDRVSRTISDWGRTDGLFATDADADRFYDELTTLCLNQYLAFNSPVWFNVGLYHQYGIEGPANNYRWDPETRRVAAVEAAYKYPQGSACFIQSVADDMMDIMRLATSEAMLFKYGSGTGTDLSTLRSSKEKLSGGGKPSGPVSFMRVYDSIASVIKSGGKTRRAAKMQTLKCWHPDILEFIECKANEERKAQALIRQGYDANFNGEAYSSVCFQNANLSIRCTDEFLSAATEGREWSTRAVTTGRPMTTHDAGDLLDKIAEGTWLCGDPGMQYEDTIQDWHTCANTGPINSSNPCSEFMFLDDTACNLSSLNLMRFRDETGCFDVERFRAACRVAIIAQEILVDHCSYPTDRIALNSHRFRPLGLGFANLGSLIMASGRPYDSDEGRDLAAGIAAVMHGQAYLTSAELARHVGPFDGYALNREPMLRVMGKHAEAVDQIGASCPDSLRNTARVIWDECLDLGREHGYRNSQVTVLAPTGTIAFMMDCDTTGIEPDIALVKYKQLAGGGMLKIVNRTVPLALQTLGYDEPVIRGILDYIDREDTIEGAPGLESEHLAVFDCAFPPAQGVRSIYYTGHIRMMAAVQPFLSGAISKTVNMPREATVEDVRNAYLEGHALGLKALAIYRDGSKESQPLSTKSEEGSQDTQDAPVELASKDAPVTEAVPSSASHEGSDTTEVSVSPSTNRPNNLPRRERLPDTRRSLTHKFDIQGHEGYVTVGFYEDGRPGEVFITMAKEGSTIGGLMDVIGTAISIGLQYGVPLEVFANKFAHSRFEPSGFTKNPDIPIAKSVTDYIFRWLGMEFIPGYREANSAQRMPVLPDDLPDPHALQGSPMSGPSVSAAVDPISSAITASPIRPEPVLTAPLQGGAPSDLDRIKVQDQEFARFQSDAPACDVCGALTVRCGTCYRCFNCGNSMGCS